MTNNPLILIVEDEPKLAELLKDYLVKEGYATHIIHDGAAVEDWFRTQQPSLILLDIMLPGKDGMSICKDIRKQSDVPIIMVTARVEEIDRLLGLELGADDYICKPFSPREVVARVKAVLRRLTKAEADESIHRAFDIDEAKFEISYYGRLLDVTAMEFRLLTAMLKNPRAVFSRNQLLDKLYDDQRIVTERTIDTHIKNIRKKLEAVAPEKEVIRSIYGMGYKLEVPD